MTLSSLQSEIRNFLDLLIAKEIAILANPVLVHPREEGGSRVSWPAPAILSGDLFRCSSATVDEYRAWIEAIAYSAMLFDGSLLQLSYDVVGTQVVGHRLVYFPCPFDIDERLLREEPFLEVIDLYKDSVGSIRLRSPIRFDFDPRAADDHPRTHMTLLWDHCRWAVAMPLSLGHFIRFVFKHFYPTLWLEHGFLQAWAQRRIANGHLAEREAALLHISWRDVLT